MKIKPIHEHDCQRCVFIGRINLLDAYYCKMSDGHTYILRNSGLGSDYASTEDFKNKIYLELKNSTDYKHSSLDENGIELDLRRRTLVRVLGWQIAQSMERCSCMS